MGVSKGGRARVREAWARWAKHEADQWLDAWQEGQGGESGDGQASLGEGGHLGEGDCIVAGCNALGVDGVEEYDGRSLRAERLMTLTLLSFLGRKRAGGF